MLKTRKAFKYYDRYMQSIVFGYHSEILHKVIRVVYVHYLVPSMVSCHKRLLRLVLHLCQMTSRSWLLSVHYYSKVHIDAIKNTTIKILTSKKN